MKKSDKKFKTVIEHWVEVKVWPKEHEYFINGATYVPLPLIEEFSHYSYQRVRGLIAEERIDKRAIKKICNLTFIKRDYIPALQMMYFDPNKHNREQYMIDIYYKRVEL